jgi:hypothetical protein
MNYKTLYDLCLRLYPSDFRDEFGDEMRDVFAEYISDIDNTPNMMYAIFNELLDTIWTAFGLHVYGTRQRYQALSDELRMLVQARWIIRIASLLNALFFVLVTIEPYVQTSRPERLVFLVFFCIQLVCVLFALKWERVGGIIILTATLTIAPIIFFGTAYPGLELYSFIASALWTIPYGGFAIAYLVLGQRQFMLQKRMLA